MLLPPTRADPPLRLRRAVTMGATSAGGPAVWTIRGMDWGRRGHRAYRARPRTSGDRPPAGRTTTSRARPSTRIAPAPRPPADRHVNVTPDLDAPRAAREAGFRDAVTIAFGDAAADVYGTVRLGLADGNAASGLVVLFRGGEIATVVAEGGMPVEDGSAWERRPGRRHRHRDDRAAAQLAPGVRRRGREPRPGPRGERPAVRARGRTIPSPAPAACSASSSRCACAARCTSAASGSRSTRVGQRGRSWGSPDWSKIGRTRTVSAWFDDEALSVAAIGAAGGEEHGREAISATDLRGGRRGLRARRRPAPLDDVRRRRPSAPRGAGAVGHRRRPAAPRDRRRRLRHDARPRPPAAGLRVPELADGRPDGRRPLRHPAAQPRASSRNRAGPRGTARGTPPRARRRSRG